MQNYLNIILAIIEVINDQMDPKIQLGLYKALMIINDFQSETFSDTPCIYDSKFKQAIRSEKVD